ncbi:ankyrin repeat and SOCS box protein 1 [Sigmodon hispidus]
MSPTRKAPPARSRIARTDGVAPSPLSAAADFSLFGHAHVPPFPWAGTGTTNQEFPRHANKPRPQGKGVSPDFTLPSQTPLHSFAVLTDQFSSPLARPEVDTQAPCRKSRKCNREAHTGRKPSPGHAHLPEASEVSLRVFLIGSLRRPTNGQWGQVRAEAESRVGMAEGGSPEGPAGPGPAGPNLKEWLREQFCDHPLEHCEDTRLHDAAYVGDLQTLRNLLQEESYRSRINEKSVWCCGWLPCTPLRIAATAGHGNCVDFLIRKGAEVDLVDVKGQTALYVAVVNGHLESTKILLEAGADPNGSRHHRSTPVYHASRVGRDDILKALIRYGADVDVNHQLTPEARPPFSRRLTSLVVCPLYISAAYHNLQCFRLLLQAGANPDFNCNGPVNTQEFYRGSPGCVMDAVLRHGCEAAFVSLLVEFGANLNLVKWESLGPEARGRRKMDPEALQVFKEARSIPRTLLSLCRVAVRRALGKYRLHLVPSLPLPDPIKKFLLYE